jgi:hypothetical protein
MFIRTTSTKLHEAALELARSGRAVFPCQPRGKVPVTARGVSDATTDCIRINSWWDRVPELNIGIATGSVSGFFVLDVDGDNGEAALQKLEHEHGALPATVEAITGKGRHCYFKVSKHELVKNSAGQIAPGLDVRGDGGYVIAPPSIHITGKPYCWSVDSTDSLADAPEWLLEKARGNTANGKGKPLEHWHHVLTGPVNNGQRNSTLASVCGKLVHSGITNVVLLVDLMLCVNAARCFEPLSEDEVETIVESVVRGHLKRAARNE